MIFHLIRHVQQTSTLARRHAMHAQDTRDGGNSRATQEKRKEGA